MPVVSVVIPAYNAEHTLGRSLDSVLAQTFDDLELIVVDDGSRDGTAAVAQRYPAVRVVRQANAGASAARNRGAREATGEFIAFLDADDCWHPDKLRLQVQALRLHPDARLCRCGGTLDRAVFDACVAQGRRAWPVTVFEDFASTFLDPYFGMPAVVVRREAFLAVNGFDEKLKIAEDVDFYLRVLVEAPKVLRVDADLLYIDQRDTGLGADSVAGYRQLLKVYARLVDAHPGYFASRQALVRQARGQLELRLARSLLWRGERGEAWQAAWRSLRLRPSTAPWGVLARCLVPAGLRQWLARRLAG